MDKATLAGLGVATIGILGGDLIEGGKISALIQPTAFMIVLGGTIGATLVQVSMPTFIKAVKAGKLAFAEPPDPRKKLIDEIVNYASIARKDGILALEPLAAKASHPFLARALTMAVDGADSAAMRDTLEGSIHHTQEEGDDIAKVYEAGGGYSPTIGIIGAVLGLIQVMSNLSDIAKVGEGIAVAFVATIYGVAFANIIFLPFAAKLKLRTRATVQTEEMLLEGALAIQQGMNPKVIKDRLSGMGGGGHDDHGKDAAAEKAAA